uniref:Uncharacterized protein n=1 Tax=Arion vulgaris TaxID=1028688 RepID=A0A0B7AJ26_9EUPU
MDKSILVCFFFCFMIFHINFAVSESQDVDDQVRELATRLPTNEDQDDAGNHQDILPPLAKEYSDSDLSNGDVPELPSTLNIDTKSNNVDANNSKSNVDIQIEPDSDSESELPPLFSDRFKYLVHHKLTDINVEDNLAESHANKDTELALLNSQPQSFDAESENTQDDETTISSIPGDRTYTTDDWFDKENMDSEEEYPENEDNKEDIDAVKEEDQVGNLGERGNDDDDDEYYVTKWTHEDDDDEDDDNETEWDAETDDDVEEDFDELKNHVVNEPVDELAKKSKIPTAPTSMVLFYTWMIVAVLIVIVGISTYQSRCRGFKFPGIKTASNSKDDRKRLIEHEFV